MPCLKSHLKNHVKTVHEEKFEDPIHFINVDNLKTEEDFDLENAEKFEDTNFKQEIISLGEVTEKIENIKTENDINNFEIQGAYKKFSLIKSNIYAVYNDTI